MSLMHILFGVHPRKLVKYLGRMIKALKVVLASEIKWPSEEEWKVHLHQLGSWLPQKDPSFKGVIAVVDGTEIQISRPSDDVEECKCYSSKKNQYSLNAMFIVLIDGTIIYCSKTSRKLNDQALWNELNLRDLFLDKEYGVMGDGGFFFNRKKDNKEIRALKPTPKPRKKKGEQAATLSNQQKLKNSVISTYRVVVENTIGHVKRWKILSGVFRHYTATKDDQVIDIADVLAVCATLTNKKLKRNPLRKEGWCNWPNDTEEREAVVELGDLLGNVCKILE